MNGAQLTSTELAYLLASLECDEVVGIDDPSLFPGNASVRGKIFKKGQQELKENGWLIPIPEQPDEFDLDAFLLEAVSIIASPEFMIASTFVSNKDTSREVFHYLFADDAVELSAADKKHYWLGKLNGRDQVSGQIAAFMQIEGEDRSVDVTIDEKALEKIKRFVLNGKITEAAKVLDSENLDEDDIHSILSAIESDAYGSLIIVRVVDGEISTGRRLSIYRSGDQDWMVCRLDPQSTDMQLRYCSRVGISDFIKNFCIN
jgi:hypothetical protein